MCLRCRQWRQGIRRAALALPGLLPLVTLSCVSSPPPGAVAPPPPGKQIAAEERVRRDERDPLAARLALAERYRRAEKLPEAVRALQSAAQIAPEAVEPHRRLAAIFREAGYLDRELEALEAIRRLDPNDWEAGLRLTDIYLDLQWFDRARPVLTRAALAAPTERRIFIGLSTAAYMNHRFPAMEQAAREGLRHAPDDAALLVVLAQAYRLQDRHEAAEQLLRRVIAREADEPKMQARAYADLAYLLLEKRWQPPRFAEAEAAARRALKADPEDVAAHYWLARALELQGRRAEAEPHYARVARRNVTFEAVAFHLGRLLRRSPDAKKRAEGDRLIALYRTMEEDSRRFNHALERLRNQPENPDVHREVAVWYLRTERTPEAITELRRTLSLRPDDREARRLLAEALRSSGRLREAEAYAR